MALVPGCIRLDSVSLPPSPCRLFASASNWEDGAYSSVELTFEEPDRGNTLVTMKQVGHALAAAALAAAAACKPCCSALRGCCWPRAGGGGGEAGGKGGQQPACGSTSPVATRTGACRDAAPAASHPAPQTGIPEADRYGHHDIVNATEVGWRQQVFDRIRKVFGYGC